MTDVVSKIRARCIANETRFDNEDMSNVLCSLQNTERVLTSAVGDLRLLVAWVDSVLAGYTPHVEPGSNVAEICSKWRNA